MNVLTVQKPTAQIRLDQDGAPVPVDLIAMPQEEDLRLFPEIRIAIAELPWYEIENILCISRSALLAMLDTPWTGVGIMTWPIKSNAPVIRIPNCAKFYKPGIGFYHTLSR